MDAAVRVDRFGLMATATTSFGSSTVDLEGLTSAPRVAEFVCGARGVRGLPLSTGGDARLFGRPRQGKSGESPALTRNGVITALVACGPARMPGEGEGSDNRRGLREEPGGFVLSA